MSRRPNARAVHIRTGRKGHDPLVDLILNEPDSYEGKLFLRAQELYENELKKRYIEACLLATTDISKIVPLLEIDAEVLIHYSKIYYDIEGMDHLDRIQLASVKNKEEASLKMWALTQGLDFLAWRLGKRADVTPPLDGLKQLFDTCLYKAKEAFFNSNVTKASQESTRWVKLSMDIARLLKAWSSEGSDAQKDLEIRIKEVVADFPSVGNFHDLFADVKESLEELPEVPTDPGAESQD